MSHCIRHMLAPLRTDNEAQPPTIPVTVSPSADFRTVLLEQPTSDKSTHILTIYEIERSDAQSAAYLNATVVSVALAYVVALVSFLSDVGHAKSLGWVLLLVPFPVLSLNGYITLQVATGMLRRAYLHELESMTMNDSKSVGPRFVSMYHAAVLHRWNLPASLLTLLTMWSPLATSAGFTWYVLNGPAVVAGLPNDAVWWASLAYGMLIALNVLVIAVVLLWLRLRPRSLSAAAETRLSKHRSQWHSGSEIEPHD